MINFIAFGNGFNTCTKCKIDPNLSKFLSMSDFEVSALEHVQAVVGPDFFIDFEADVLSALCGGDGLEVEADFAGLLDECACGGACDENLIALVQGLVLDEEFGDAEAAEVFDAAP